MIIWYYMPYKPNLQRIAKILLDYITSQWKHLLSSVTWIDKIMITLMLSKWYICQSYPNMCWGYKEYFSKYFSMNDDEMWKTTQHVKYSLKYVILYTVTMCGNHIQWLQAIKKISLPQCKTAISPLLMQCIFCSLALSHHYFHSSPFYVIDVYSGNNVTLNDRYITSSLPHLSTHRQNC